MINSTSYNTPQFEVLQANDPATAMGETTADQAYDASVDQAVERIANQ